MSVSSTKKAIWSSPWGFAESIAIVAGIAIVGAILQGVIGAFDFYILANPANKIVGLATIFFSLLLALRSPKSRFARWMLSLKLTVSIIGAILILVIFMGLTPQVGEGFEPRMALGFDAMTRNWSFVLLYELLLLTLGGVVIRRLLRFCFADTPFILQHIGLWIALFASAYGYSDMERYIMYVEEGETQWRVYGSEDEVKELDIAITLHDFDMEYYQPRLAIVDRQSGEVQPSSAPQYFQIDDDQMCGRVAAWDICCEEYIHEAVRSSDSTFRELPMPGAMPAARITASSGGEQISGWVTSGGKLQQTLTLPLSRNLSVVMTPPDPRRFVSKVDVYTKQGDNRTAQIEVNHPLRIGHWWIYQYGYDNAAGALSSYSSFELVYDPWLKPLYVGVILMMCGALCMVVMGRTKGGAKL